MKQLYNIIRCTVASVFTLILPLFAAAQSISSTPYKSGFTNPIVIGHGGDDRLFVGERAGKIRIIDAAGNLLPTPFLDITAKISSQNSEEGFLGMAFSPDFATSGKFYVGYTDSIKFNQSGGPLLYSVVEQYTVSSGNPNIADPASGLVIDTAIQPFQNHNGGNMCFGKDGYLYVGYGDGGNGGDPYGNAQSLSVKLGKIHRIDVSHSTPAQPFDVPSNNPFVGQPGVKDAIWAYGLRNPWRFSFDRITGDLWIADVGQNKHEEIDFQPASSAGGENYGWVIREGFSCYNPPNGCNTPNLQPPIYDYGRSVGGSVIGGYVYRSVQSRDLWGVYLYSDFINRWIDGIRQQNGALVNPILHLNTDPGGQPISYGEDRYGELYVCFYNDGTIYKLEDGNANRAPKAFFTNTQMAPLEFQLTALEGRNISYQWMLDGTTIPGATSPTYTALQSGIYTLQITNALGNADVSDPFTMGAALPVSLSSFKVLRLTSSQVRLTWETSSEQNNSGFMVQRSLNGPGNFTDLNFVPSQAPGGNSTLALQYNFIDTNPPAQTTLFYRLKMIDRDGHYSYSDIRILAPDGNSQNRLIVSPNPVHNTLTVTWSGISGVSRILVRDTHGAKISQYNVSGDGKEINLRFLPKGMYILQLCDNKGKVIDQRKIIRD